MVMSMTVAFVTAIIAAGYWQREKTTDWFIWLLPVAVPLSIGGMCIQAGRFTTKSSHRAGTWIGFSAGSILYLLFPTLQLLLQYDLIQHDGTAYWGLLAMPSVFLGVPLPLLGATCGLVVDKFRGTKANTM